jgi:hypothetical protein
VPIVGSVLGGLTTAAGYSAAAMAAAGGAAKLYGMYKDRKGPKDDWKKKKITKGNLYDTLHRKRLELSVKSGNKHDEK